MKINLFIKKLNELGYTTNISEKNCTKKKSKILITKKGEKQPCAWVFLNEMYSMRIFSSNSKLFFLMSDFAITPLKLREDEDEFLVSKHIDSYGFSHLSAKKIPDDAELFVVKARNSSGAIKKIQDEYILNGKLFD